MAKRKMPVKTRRVVLDGEWEGWEFTARTNPPIGAFETLSDGELVDGLIPIILDWNFVDEDGNLLPKPSRESIARVPVDLLNVMVEKYMEEVTDSLGPKSETPS